MDRRARGTWLGARPLLPCLLLALLCVACGDAIVSTRPDGSAGQSPAPTSSTPTSSGRIPTPVPTVPTTPGASVAPTPGATLETGGLLVRLTSCDHTCGPQAGTTILDDGRIIWQDGERVFEGRLRAAALETARTEIEGTAELRASGEYRPELRPGAEPIGHGTTLYRFDRETAGDDILVTSTDPRSLADQPEAWIIPPGAEVLADLADRLMDPVAWLGPDAFVESPEPYEADRHLVVVELFPDLDDVVVEDVDADDVEWPFGEPIETVGEPLPGGEFGPASRCLIIDAAAARRTADEEREEGRLRDLRLWSSSQEYGWKRASGFVTVSLTALLPHESGTCTELVGPPPE